MEILFILLFAYLRKMKSERLQKAAQDANFRANETLHLDQAKQALPVIIK